jgi:hypothetical protein
MPIIKNSPKPLTYICTDLAKKIVLDGEGSDQVYRDSRLIGGKNHEQAKTDCFGHRQFQSRQDRRVRQQSKLGTRRRGRRSIRLRGH